MSGLSNKISSFEWEHRTPLESAPPLVSSFDKLRLFAQKKEKIERCELCSAELYGRHSHLVDPANHRLVCACKACSVLFSHRGGRFRRVPDQIKLLADFKLTESQWEELEIPVQLAFFYRSSVVDKLLCFYPSITGATECLLKLDLWREIEKENPILNTFESDVEALLINRIEGMREYYKVPIDECYRLVGMIRSKWKGFSGGTRVWESLKDFFEDLKHRSCDE